MKETRTTYDLFRQGQVVDQGWDVLLINWIVGLERKNNALQSLFMMRYNLTLIDS
jgi:hypothetical protein